MGKTTSGEKVDSLLAKSEFPGVGGYDEFAKNVKKSKRSILGLSLEGCALRPRAAS